MGWFGTWRKSRGSAPSRTQVVFDDECVTCRRPSGLVESVRWEDLQIVFIQTTDAGPAFDDVFWVLGGNDAGCVVPSEAEGTDLLIARLQQLPGFDYQAAIDAMSCTENREFVCWRRPAAGGA